jgi:SAM-dependent methyltransferase
VQATTNTRQGYNLLAPRFELTDYATPAWLIEACRARVDSLFPLTRPRAEAVGADLACGTGLASLVLYRTCATVEGYDFSPGMLAQARAKAEREERGGGFTFREADLATLELPPQRYDRIVTFGAWGHILPPWRARLMEQVLGSIRPGGVFFTVTADPARRLSRRWIRSALFDLAMHARNRLLGDPFHMYYLLNDTLTVKHLLEKSGPCQVRLEPLPRWPHPALTLLMASPRPANGP